MKASARNLRVGVFVMLVLAVLFVVVFVLGQKQSLFHRKVHLRASFANTSGLVVGTAVRLAGVDVGVVDKIAFDEDLKVRQVHVELGVSSAYRERIRGDSIARLSSKGLLGDMVIDIGVGSADAAPLRDGDTLRTQESEGLTEIIRSVQDAIGEVRTLSKTTTGRIDALLSDRVVGDVGRAVRSIADISDEAAHGRGTVHALLHDPKLADDFIALGASGRRAGASAARAMARVDALLAGDGVAKMPADLAAAVKGIAELITEVKTGDGLAHTLVYEEDGSQLIENLRALSATLRGVGDEVAQGKGTVGALLKDPTVYQDLKLLLGNVRRSRILRALVRYTIAHDGLRAGSAPAK